MFINFPVKINRKKLKKNNHKTTKTQKEQKASCLVVSPGFTKKKKNIKVPHLRTPTMLRKVTTTTLSTLSKIQRSHPTNSVLTALSSQTFTFNKPCLNEQKRWNKKFRARELDELWEKYSARRWAEQEGKDAGVGAVSLQSDAVQLDLSPPSDELVAWGDFELQPFVELLEFPEITFHLASKTDMGGAAPFNKFDRAGDALFLGTTSDMQVGRDLGELLKSNGVMKVEQREYQNRSRHVKRTTAKRRLARTRKFNTVLLVQHSPHTIHCGEKYSR